MVTRRMSAVCYLPQFYIALDKRAAKESKCKCDYSDFREMSAAMKGPQYRRSRNVLLMVSISSGNKMNVPFLDRLSLYEDKTVWLAGPFQPFFHYVH